LQFSSIFQALRRQNEKLKTLLAEKDAELKKRREKEKEKAEKEEEKKKKKKSTK